MTENSLLRKTSLLPGISFLTILFILVAFTNYELSPWKIVGDALWVSGQAGILITLYSMHRLDLNGKRWIHKTSLLVASIGSASYIIGAVWNTQFVMNFLCIQPMLIFFPLGAFLLAIGMTWIGIQIIRRNDNRWSGAGKFSAFIVGLYPFFVMFPAVIITGYPNIYLIMLWGGPWLFFGISLRTKSVLSS